MIFTIYLRVEAILLVPFFLLVFLTLSDNGVIKTFKARIKILFTKLFSQTSILLLILVSVILIEPQIYTTIATTPELQANAAFYLYPNTPIFSSSYILPNLSVNLSFLVGLLKDYPIVFLPNITALAVLGVLFLLLNRKYKNKLGILLLLLGFFFIYFMFYLFYFSGSVLVGDAVRYFLILYPALSILATFGVLGLGDWLLSLTGRSRRLGRKRVRYLIYTVLISLIFVVPFVYITPFLTHPMFTYYGFPVNNVTANIQGLNPYTTQYAKASADFIQSNYRLVPPDCLVLSGVLQCGLC